MRADLHTKSHLPTLLVGLVDTFLPFARAAETCAPFQFRLVVALVLRAGGRPGLASRTFQRIGDRCRAYRSLADVFLRVELLLSAEWVAVLTVIASREAINTPDSFSLFMPFPLQESAPPPSFVERWRLASGSQRQANGGRTTCGRNGPWYRRCNVPCR